MGGGRWEEGGGRREVERKDVGTEKRVGGSISNQNISGRCPYWRVQPAAQ